MQPWQPRLHRGEAGVEREALEKMELAQPPCRDPPEPSRAPGPHLHQPGRGSSGPEPAVPGDHSAAGSQTSVVAQPGMALGRALYSSIGFISSVENGVLGLPS